MHDRNGNKLLVGDRVKVIGRLPGHVHRFTNQFGIVSEIDRWRVEVTVLEGLVIFSAYVATEQDIRVCDLLELPVVTVLARGVRTKSEVTCDRQK